MKRISLLLLCLVALLYLNTACDSLGDDVAPANLFERTDGEVLEVYTYPGGTAVINIQDWIVAATPNNNAGSPSTFQISMQPLHGNLEIDPRGFLIYHALRNFIQVTDYIGVRIVHEGGVTDNFQVRIQIATDMAVFPCQAGAISDSLAIKTDSDGNILEVLSNDRICQDAAVQLSAATTPPHGTLGIVNNTFSYKPKQEFSGTDYFIYKLCQTTAGNGTNCTLAFVLLEVSPTAGACNPLAADDEYTISAYTEASGEAAYVALQVLENDELCGEEPAAFSISDPAGAGQTYIEENKIYYQPKRGFTGVDTFKYSICNTSGTCSEGSVAISCQ